MTRAPMRVVWWGALLASLAGLASSRLALRDRTPDGRATVWSDPTPSRAGAGTQWHDTPDSSWTKAPFRASRAAPPEEYTPELAQMLELDAAAEAAHQAVAEAKVEAAARLQEHRPPWVLTGIILATPPAAIFSDVPGRPGGTVLTTDDEVDGFVVAWIDGDSVVVSRGGDRWTFGAASPWEQ